MTLWRSWTTRQRSVVIRLRRLTWRQWLLLAEGFCSLGVAWIALRLVPFKRLAAGWGEPRTESAADTHTDSGPVDGVSWAVQTAGRRTPWRSTCLVQALSARWMLRRRGKASTIYFGLTKGEAGDLEAHAWLRCGTKVLTGARGRRRYTVVSAFAEDATRDDTQTGI